MPKLRQKLNKLAKKAKAQKKACFSCITQKFKNSREELKKSIDLESFGGHRLKMLVLIFLIAFTGYVLLFRQNYAKIFLVQKNERGEKTIQELKQEKLGQDLRGLVAGHPIERMIPYIAQKDRKTAAYLIGIAKKESAWGERRPVLAGKDCYNYWGFRMERERMGSGGHTCFDSPREAVNVVSRRIAEIIERNDAESAKDLLVWKCGNDCASTGGRAAADKWAMDVDYYAEQILN